MPFSTSTNPQRFHNWQEIDWAIEERGCPAGFGFFAYPQQFFDWAPGVSASGIISAAAATYIEDGTIGGVGFVDGSAIKRFAPGFLGTFNGTSIGGDSPGNYSVIINSESVDGDGHLDQRLVFRAFITDCQDGPSRLIFASLADNENFRLNWLGRGGTYAGLAGLKYRVIKSDGYSWAERWLEWPNSREYEFGLVAEVVSTTSITVTRAGRSTSNFPADVDLMIQDAAGSWQRAAITTLDGTTYTYAPTTEASAGAWTVNVGAGYYLIERDGYWLSNQRKMYSQVQGRDGTFNQITATGAWQPFQWYRGEKLAYYSHSPATDALASVECVAQQVVSHNVGQTFCADVLDDLFDVDLYTNQDDICEGERLFNPHLYKTIRGKQLAAEQMSASFADPDNEPHPPFRAATWFESFAPGDNHTVSFLSAGAVGSATINITLPFQTPGYQYPSLRCTWAIVEDDGDISITGLGTVTATTLTASGSFAVHDGKLIVIAFGSPDGSTYGWTRKYERRFRYMFPTEYFSPEFDAITEAYIDPPTSDFPGEWIARDASTNYAEWSEIGTLGDTGPAFVAQEAARYIGDDFYHPTTNTLADDPLDAQTSARDAGGWVGVRHTAGNDPRFSGQVSAATAISITDATAAWWTQNGSAGQGVLIAHEHTSTGGTTNTLIDTARAGSGFWDGTQGRWEGFVLEVSFDAGVTYERRPITGYVAGTQTITVGTAFSASTSGKPYRVREPKYRRNQWKGRTLTITLLDGSQVTATITHSDDTTLYFAAMAGGPVPAGSTYVIDDPQIGGVYHWVDGSWLRPTDDDVDPDTRGKDWHENVLENAPTTALGFGRFRKGDCVFGHLLRELRNGIKKQKWTQAGASWTQNGENAGRLGEFIGSAGATWADAKAFAEDMWDDDLTSSSETVPMAQSGGTHDFVDGAEGLILQRAYAYAQVTGIPTCLNSTLTVWGKAGTSTGATTEDPDGGSNDDADTFDANGDGFALNQWRQVYTDTPNNSATRISSRIGNRTAKPTWVSEPIGTAMGNNTVTKRRGYKVLDQRALLKWDVAGGLSFV